MSKRFRIMTAVLTVVIMVVSLVSLSGCKGSTATADDVFKGELVDAQTDRVVVMGPEETMLFVTTDKTEYDTGDEEGMCVGDQVEVDYHKGDGTFVADAVRVTSHGERAQVFGGEVTELEKHYVTVRSDRITAGFDYDEETKIQGNLSEGDAVTITYTGKLNERPYAISIVVIQEQDEKSLKSVHGTVSEIAKESVLISMDSADACRFIVTPDTIIRGDDTKMKIGDEVNLVYTGDIGYDPIARTIVIQRDKNRIYYVMDGVIEKVTSNTLKISTAKKTYTFRYRDETRIQNPEYLENGHKTTITYVGELDKDPVAASIYCSKETVSKKEKEKHKATEATKATKATDPTKKPTKATDPTKGTKATDPTKGSDPTKPTKGTDPTKPTEATDPTDPTDVTDPTEPTENTEPTDPTEDTEATDPTEDTEATEPTEDTTEATEPTEDTTEATEPPEPEYVIINAEGTIVRWGNPCTIKLTGGSTIKLDISDASLSGGYVPAIDDMVKVAYEKDDMKLLDIQLMYRAADDSDSSNSASDDSDDSDSDE